MNSQKSYRIYQQIEWWIKFRQVALHIQHSPRYFIQLTEIHLNWMVLSLLTAQLTICCHRFFIFTFSHSPRLDYGFSSLTNPMMSISLSIKDNIMWNIFHLGDSSTSFSLISAFRLNRLWACAVTRGLFLLFYPLHKLPVDTLYFLLTLGVSYLLSLSFRLRDTPELAKDFQIYYISFIIEKS